MRSPHEQSMLARIQVVICFSTLPNGSQKAKGSAGFIDRSDFAMQVATRLPWHPSTIPYLALLNETPGANPGEPPKLKELRCRRAVLQICLAFCIQNFPAYADLPQTANTDVYWNEFPVDGFIDPQILQNQTELDRMFENDVD